MLNTLYTYQSFFFQFCEHVKLDSTIQYNAVFSVQFWSNHKLKLGAFGSGRLSQFCRYNHDLVTHYWVELNKISGYSWCSYDFIVSAVIYCHSYEATCCESAKRDHSYFTPVFQFTWNVTTVEVFWPKM